MAGRERPKGRTTHARRAFRASFARMDADQAVRKASALIEHATDDATTPEEARTAAFAAVKLIKKYELHLATDDEGAPSILTPENVAAGVEIATKLSQSGIGDSIRRIIESSRRAKASRPKTRGR